MIDKVGAMIGGLTYGAKKDTALKMYKEALKLNPASAIARIEYANGLVMLEGKKALKEAEKLYGGGGGVRGGGCDGEAGCGVGEGGVGGLVTARRVFQPSVAPVVRNVRTGAMSLCFGA